MNAVDARQQLADARSSGGPAKAPIVYVASRMVRGAMDKETASMNPRALALAVTLEKGAAALAEFAGKLTDAEWQTRLPKDGRKVGVVVHHVATM